MPGLPEIKDRLVKAISQLPVVKDRGVAPQQTPAPSRPADVVEPAPPPPPVVLDPAATASVPEARALHEALQRGDAAGALGVLEGRTTPQLRSLREAYARELRGSLDDHVRQRLKGPERDRAVAALLGASGSASPLGREVALAAWRSRHDLGTVPTADLYGTRNAVTAQYVDAKEIFPAMADLIASAKSEAMLETFEWGAEKWSKDEPGWFIDPTLVLCDGVQRLQDRLKTEQAAGAAPKVPVRVYFALQGGDERSPLTAGDTGNDKARKLLLQLSKMGIDPALVEVHVGAHKSLVWGASHSKALVVDGYRAIVTGANPQAWQRLDQPWHDSGYAVKGDAGVALARDFDEMWAHSQEVAWADLEKLDPKGHAIAKTQGTRPIPHDPAALRPDLSADPDLAHADLPIFVATRTPLKLRPDEGLDTVSSPQDQAFLALLRGARSTIKIETPNLNAPAAKQAILDAVARGVRVEIVLSYGFNSASERQRFGPVDGGGSNEDAVADLYSRIADPAAKDRLQIRWGSVDGVRPTPQHEPGASHVKFMSGDGQVAIVGSANMDKASWHLIRETNLVIDSAEHVGRFDARLFDRDFETGVDVRAWARRIRSGEAPITPELTALLGDPQAWAEKVAG